MSSVAGAIVWSAPLQPAKGCVIVNVGDGLKALSGGRLHAPEYKYIKMDEDEEGLCYLEYTLRQEKWGAPHATAHAAASVIPSTLEEMENKMAQIARQKEQVEQEKACVEKEKARVERDLDAMIIASTELKAKYREQRRDFRYYGGNVSDSTDEYYDEYESLDE